MSHHTVIIERERAYAEYESLSPALKREFCLAGKRTILDSIKRKGPCLLCKIPYSSLCLDHQSAPACVFFSIRPGEAKRVFQSSWPQG